MTINDSREFFERCAEALRAKAIEQAHDPDTGTDPVLCSEMWHMAPKRDGRI